MFIRRKFFFDSSSYNSSNINQPIAANPSKIEHLHEGEKNNLVQDILSLAKIARKTRKMDEEIGQITLQQRPIWRPMCLIRCPAAQFNVVCFGAASRIHTSDLYAVSSRMAVGNQRKDWWGCRDCFRIELCCMSYSNKYHDLISEMINLVMS